MKRRRRVFRVAGFYSNGTDQPDRRLTHLVSVGHGAVTPNGEHQSKTSEPQKVVEHLKSQFQTRDPSDPTSFSLRTFSFPPKSIQLPKH